MTLSFLYWFFIVLIILFGGWRGYGPNGDRWYFGGSVLLVFELIIIGLRLFGSPLKG